MAGRGLDMIDFTSYDVAAVIVVGVTIEEAPLGEGTGSITLTSFVTDEGDVQYNVEDSVDVIGVIDFGGLVDFTADTFII